MTPFYFLNSRLSFYLISTWFKQKGIPLSVSKDYNFKHKYTRLLSILSVQPQQTGLFDRGKNIIWSVPGHLLLNLLSNQFRKHKPLLISSFLNISQWTGFRTYVFMEVYTVISLATFNHGCKMSFSLWL